MKISAKNFGPIKEAHIDMDKALTVFCGPNGTGKTYLSYLIFGLSRMKLFRSDFKLTVEELNTLFQGESLHITIDYNFLCEFRDLRFDAVKRGLAELFGCTQSECRKLAKQFEFHDDESKEVFSNRIRQQSYNMGLSIYKALFSIEKKSGEDTLEIRLTHDVVEDDELRTYVRERLISNIYNQIVLFPLTNSFFFPVERSSINIFSKEIYLHRGTLLDLIHSSQNDNATDILNKEVNRYPLAIVDNIRIANDLSALSSENGEYSELADEIEHELLHGKLSIDKEGEMKFTPSSAKTWTLPVKMTASMVKTLSSIIFYIRYLASRYDLLIIDEPELNMHPDAQIEFMRIVSKMIRRGLRLVISTHSDYIIREINHLIMLSNRSDSTRAVAKRIGYEEDMWINPDEIGAYVFTPQRKNGKTIVKQVDVSKEGFEVETFDNAIDRLNQTSEEIFFSLKSDEKDNIE